RGPLSEEEYARLKEYLESKGTHVVTQRRVFFDVSQTLGINNRVLDVRAKVTNGDIQIVVKKGKQGSVSREEAEVRVGSGGLKQALHVLALLGYPKGLYGDRNIERYALGEVEFALQEVVSVRDGKHHSRFYEAEILTNVEGSAQAEEKLRTLLSAIGLHVFDREGWNAYESSLDGAANDWFESGVTDISRFE
ncbi:MAG: hypothetical protein RLZZ26_450, partial [Candidatus Parcubacteria bacterium]